MPWIFWMVLAICFIGMMSHRYRRYGSGWEPEGRWDRPRALGRGRRIGPETERSEPRLERELESQRGYIETLESRINELENRLDFTERLLAGRHRGEPDRSTISPSAASG
ncbi:MAG TPA: hypothetical protein VH879_02865 [Gemmatimonadales bacterium]|jgi:hypothetical protein